MKRLLQCSHAFRRVSVPRVDEVDERAVHRWIERGWEEYNNFWAEQERRAREAKKKEDLEKKRRKENPGRVKLMSEIYGAKV
jgi:hypothetical protein